MAKDNDNSRGNGPSGRDEYKCYSDAEIKDWLRQDRLPVEERKALLERLNSGHQPN